MNSEQRTDKAIFYEELKGYMLNREEISVKKIYSLFPDINPKTISWRLHDYVRQGIIHRTGQGYYSLNKMNENNPAGYSYLQKKSQLVYDIVIDYGYDFYITGLDSLTGELLHMPEKYPILLVLEDKGITEIQDILGQKDMIVVTEKDCATIENNTIKSKIDIMILRGKDFSLSFEHIAQKEKGFVDLWLRLVDALTTLRLFTNPLIYSMTCSSDYKPKTISEKKVALFIIMPDEKTTYYTIASLLVSQHYELLLNAADERGGRLKNRVNFMLDEFGNFAAIPSFANKLTVGGGRGIRFNLFLQSFSQLDEKYNKEVSKTIKGNCQTWIYLQSDDLETLEEISKKLGNYTVSTYPFIPKEKTPGACQHVDAFYFLYFSILF